MISVILLMAGSGKRMEINTNKVLLPLNDKKIYEYSLDVFSSLNLEVICVIAEADKDLIKLPPFVKYTYGGDTRLESVYNGLKVCSGDYVLIHDAARPFIDINIIKDIVNNNNYEPIMCCHRVTDTIWENNKCLDRESLIAASTPQCASYDLLFDAYSKAVKSNIKFTDDISVLKYYYPNMIVNYKYTDGLDFKITTYKDYEYAKYIVNKK